MIRPIKYNLTFEPDLKKFIFKAKEVLTFKVLKRTRIIELDAVELKIVNCKLLIVNRNVVSSFNVDNKSEKLIVRLSKELERGEYKIFIEFEGILNHKLAGFYRSRYVHDAKEKYIATTQFEAADARRAFLCVDNPSFKATFDLTFIIDKNLTAISNTLPTSGVGNTVAINQRKKIVRFEKTLLMSTYLLYLGVGEFEFLEDTYSSEVNFPKIHPRIEPGYTPEVRQKNKQSYTSGVKYTHHLGGDTRSRVIQLRVITTPGKSQYGKFALDCTKKFLKFYEDYFDYPYPLKKLDLIAIPDFASGAMENWGAITFRENALLLYPQLSSRATMQRIAEVVAHELVHQWFGNLVTMKWWDDLWLNESFATYMAYKALDNFWPEWNVWTDYLIHAVFGAMSLDGMKSTRPIHAKVLNPREIDEHFDEIAYEKGGSILRMIDEYLEFTSFRNGLRSYIRKFAYKNAQANDLWTCIQKASQKPVKDIMRKFIMQEGFPLIDVEMEKNRIKMKQKRFLFLNFKDNNKWIIPLVNKIGKKDYKQVLFAEKEKKLEEKKMQFFYLNSDYSSFAVTQYDPTSLQKLGENIHRLNDLEAIGLIHDLFSLAVCNNLKLDQCLKFIDVYLKKEKRVEVLQYIIGRLSGFYLLIPNDELKKLIICFANKALGITGLYPRKKEDVNNTHVRNISLSVLSSFDDAKIHSFILNEFEKFVKTGKLYPDLRAVVYGGIVWADQKKYQTIQRLYEESSVQEEKVKLLMALGNSKNQKLIQDTLEYGLSEKVRFSDFFYLVAATSRNRYGKELTYNWFCKNWENIKKRTGGHSTVLFRRMLKMIVPTGAVRKKEEAVKFLNTHRIEGLERTYEQVKEELKINARFADLYSSSD